MTTTAYDWDRDRIRVGYLVARLADRRTRDTSSSAGEVMTRRSSSPTRGLPNVIGESGRTSVAASVAMAPPRLCPVNTADGATSRTSASNSFQSGFRAVANPRWNFPPMDHSQGTNLMFCTHSSMESVPRKATTVIAG
ncbi:MAG: hypothetical protein VW169_12300, partial [Rhodospirillaceae bacterium]